MIASADYHLWYQRGVDETLGVGEFFEQIIEKLGTATLEPGNFALDGGANRGRHTFPIAERLGSNGLVIGVEAAPDLASRLAEHCRGKGKANIIILPFALGESKGSTPFVYIPAADGYSGRLQREGIPEGAISSIEHMVVPMTTIDTIAGEHSPRSLRFIKLDLEGGEYHALLGAERTMNVSGPLIVFENGRRQSSTTYQYSTTEWFDMFSSRGYRVFDLFGRPFGEKQWDDQYMPFYFIGAKRVEDLDFIESALPKLIESLANI